MYTPRSHSTGSKLSAKYAAATSQGLVVLGVAGDHVTQGLFLAGIFFALFPAVLYDIGGTRNHAILVAVTSGCLWFAAVFHSLFKVLKVWVRSRIQSRAKDREMRSQLRIITAPEGNLLARAKRQGGQTFVSSDEVEAAAAEMLCIRGLLINKGFKPNPNGYPFVLQHVVVPNSVLRVIDSVLSDLKFEAPGESA